MKLILLLLISLNSFAQSLEKSIPKPKKSIYFTLSETQYEGFTKDFKTQSFGYVNDFNNFLYGFEVETSSNQEIEASVKRYNFVIGFEKKEKFFTYPYILLSLGKNEYNFKEDGGNGFSNGLDIGMNVQKLFPITISAGFKYTKDYFHDYGNSTSYNMYLRFSFKFK